MAEPFTYTTEQARMRLREQLATGEEWPQDGTAEEYFIRAVFPDDPEPASPQKDGGEGGVSRLEEAQCPAWARLDKLVKGVEAEIQRLEEVDHDSGLKASSRKTAEGLGRLVDDVAKGWPASPSEERSADDLLADLRPASRAHIALVAAVLQCIESDVEPDTIRRFVNEELPASPSPVEGRTPDCDDICKCGHVRHEHHYYPDPEAGPETGRCAHCGCASFGLAGEEDDAEVRDRIAYSVEHGTSPQSEALRVLRRFMCCQAGEEMVEYGLARPFGYTLAALPPAPPAPVVGEAPGEGEWHG